MFTKVQSLNDQSITNSGYMYVYICICVCVCIHGHDAYPKDRELCQMNRASSYTGEQGNTKNPMNQVKTCDLTSFFSPSLSK